ncbi:MAG: hypothetical protein KatS3mg105_3438 [Gemmatales bacterium]|nr:MAG: hypothetical protein KatS3mg105_3438 [Gemmatales bacterium]
MFYDVFPYLLIFFVLTLITLVGHGIWVLLSRVVGAVFGYSHPMQRCPRCRSSYRPTRRVCPGCGLDGESALAQKIRDLAASERLLSRYLRENRIDHDAVAGILKQIRLEQDQLLRRQPVFSAQRASEDIPTVVPVSSPVTAVESSGGPATEAEPAWRLLDRRLGQIVHVVDLPARERQAIVSLYERLSTDELQKLSPPSQLQLARLLRLVGMPAAALCAYRRVLASESDSVLRGDIALEAGRFAVQAEALGDARWFFSRALSESTPEYARKEAAKALASLASSQPRSPVLQVPSEPAANAKAAVIATAPAAPRRSLSELLAAFMEKSNILWGELAGGLLIVGCSIALVISLWSKLEQNPVYQFGIFVGITSMLFGAGLYTLHHWKLESTSRGLLIIATLLVPLNFLAIAAQTKESTHPGQIALEVCAIGVFAVLLRVTADVLVRGGRNWLPFSVLGASASQLLLPRLFSLGEADAWRIGCIACLPVAFFLAGSLSWLWTNYRKSADATELASGVFVFLGVSLFAVATSFALIVTWYANFGGDVEVVRAALAFPVALCALPVLSGGFRVHGFLADRKEEAAKRTAGTAVGLAGAVILLAAIPLAWWYPKLALAVGVFDFAVLTILAFSLQIPVAHAFALACFITGWWLGASQLAPEAASIKFMQQEIFGPTDIAWLALVLALGAVSEILCRLKLREHAAYYGLGCGATALIGLGCSVPVTNLSAPLAALKPGLVFGLYAIGGLVFNVRWRRPFVTACSLASLVAATLWWLRAILPDSIAVWSAVLAIEGLLFSLAALSLRQHHLFFYREPLARSAEAIVPFVVALTLWSGWPKLAWDRPHLVAGAAVGILFVLTSVIDRSRSRLRWANVFFISTSVIAGTTYLASADWFIQQTGKIARFFDPRALYVYGIALGTYGLLCSVGRVVLQSLRKHSSWLESHWPAWDRIVLEGLTIALATLTVAGGIPILSSEWLSPQHFSSVFGVSWLHLFDYRVWLLHGVLAASFLCGLWERRCYFAGYGLAILGLILPLMAAGWDLPQPASAHVLRWGLAAIFVAGSTLIWFRQHLVKLGKLLRMVELDRKAIRSPRRLVFSTTLIPLVAISVTAAVLPFWGIKPFEPVHGFFSRFQSTVLLAVPLLLAAAALIGHAFFERKSSYIFAAGVLTTAVVLMAHALHVLGDQAVLPSAAEVPLRVQLIQLSVLTLSVIGLIWLSVRPRFDKEGIYLRLNFGIAAAGLTFLLSIALTLLSLASPNDPYPWTVEAGSAWSWFALITSAAGIAFLVVDQRHGLRPHVLGLIAVAFFGLASCTMTRIVPEWAYRMWLSGWSLCPLVWVGCAWGMSYCRDRIGLRLASQWIDATVFWVRLATVITTVLAVKAAFFHNDQLWAGMATALAFPASAALAVWQRREGWAFCACLGTNLAVSMLLWEARKLIPFIDWWVVLIYSNISTSAVTAMIWLGIRHRLYGYAELSFRRAPLLALHIGLSLFYTIVLIAIPLCHLLMSPGRPMPSAIAIAGSNPGWLAFLLIVIATGWYAHQIDERSLRALFRKDKSCFDPRRSSLPMSLLSLFGLGVGVLCACRLSSLDTGNWLSYHVLVTEWALTALAVLVVGWQMARVAQMELEGWALASVRETTSSSFWEEASFVRWAFCIASLVAVLAFRAAWADPWRPWFSTAITVFTAGIIAALAVWSPKRSHVIASGILLNAAGSMFWIGKGWTTWEMLMGVQIACCGLASLLWTLAGISLAISNWSTSHWQKLQSVEAWGSRCFAAAAISLLSVLTLTGVIVQTAGFPFPISIASWTGLMMTLIVFIVRLWHPGARFGLPALYSTGLLAILISILSRGMTPADFGWWSALGISLFVLVTAGVAGWFQVRQELLQRWRLPVRQYERSWFETAQMTLMLVVASLSVWMSIGFAEHSRRLAGAGVLVPLIASGVLLAHWADRLKRPVAVTWQGCFRQITMALVLLTAVNLGWALLLPADHSLVWLWLHRSVWLLAVLFPGTALCTLVLPRVLPGEGAWTKAGLKLAPTLATLAVLVLADVLVQEAWLYQLPHWILQRLATINTYAVATGLSVPAAIEEPMHWLAVIMVAISLLVVIVCCIRNALRPGQDFLNLPPHRRTLYVYVAELLVLVLFLHIRITQPELFRHGVFLRYWPFMVMAIAFVGVGLSEAFNRRNLNVLAEPLERTGIVLPMLPVLAFCVLPGTLYGSLWFTAGLLYGLLAVRKRSFAFAITAAIAANIGLWVWLHHLDVHFWKHPQIWLIPPALVALAAGHFNRDRLSPSQANWIRYLALLTIYLSSSADMFLAGIGNSWTLPIVLALLSVVGILTGMMVRIRAFLVLGTTFLFLVVFSIIWHAGIDQQQTWILYAFGIALGAAILAFFGVFEKRRNDVLKVLDDFKRWQ